MVRSRGVRFLRSPARSVDHESDGRKSSPIPRPHRAQLPRRGIKPRIAARNTEQGGRLSVYRWVAERTSSSLNQFRRLRIRYERRAYILEAFLAIGCNIICFRVVVL